KSRRLTTHHSSLVGQLRRLRVRRHVDRVGDGTGRFGRQEDSVDGRHRQQAETERRPADAAGERTGREGDETVDRVAWVLAAHAGVPGYRERDRNAVDYDANHAEIIEDLHPRPARRLVLSAAGRDKILRTRSVAAPVEQEGGHAGEDFAAVLWVDRPR